MGRPRDLSKAHVPGLPSLTPYPSPPSYHMLSSASNFVQPVSPRSAFLQFQANLYYASLWASNFCRAQGSCSSLRKQVGAPKPSLVGLFQGLLVHESGDSNSRLKRRGTSRSWGTGQFCGTDCRKLRLASWFFGGGSWAQALHLTLSLNFMCRHYRYVLCPALESPLWIHFQKPSVGYVGGQHALCMAKICSLSAVNSGNKIH